MVEELRDAPLRARSSRGRGHVNSSHGGTGDGRRPGTLQLVRTLGGALRRFFPDVRVEVGPLRVSPPALARERLPATLLVCLHVRLEGVRLVAYRTLVGLLRHVGPEEVLPQGGKVHERVRQLAVVVAVVGAVGRWTEELPLPFFGEGGVFVHGHYGLLQVGVVLVRLDVEGHLRRGGEHLVAQRALHPLLLPPGVHVHYFLYGWGDVLELIVVPFVRLHRDDLHAASRALDSLRGPLALARVLDPVRVLVRQHRHDAPLVEQDVADALVREEERAVSVLQLLRTRRFPGSEPREALHDHIRELRDLQRPVSDRYPKDEILDPLHARGYSP
mmetsp:Transcript_9311/g.37729  ORF Transcript_9311/g.37729 Transcript_9311/m.37729 type:complete len:331 (+) Transcript_9311:44-1036(+)